MNSSGILDVHHRAFRLDDLVRLKGDQVISVCIPARDEEATVGSVVAIIRRHLVDRAGLVDEVVVVDDHSCDGTARVAEEAGARVIGPADTVATPAASPGKGEALWRSLNGTQGDIVVWCDADVTNFATHFVVGLVGPLLSRPEVAFVKGYYQRPTEAGGDGGGRVTELMARPLLATLFPHLARIHQPLSGEYAGRRELLERLPFVRGYGVDLGLLIDVAAAAGPEAIAQCDLGVRIHRNRDLDELGPQALTVLQTALDRAGVPAARPTTFHRPGRAPLAAHYGEIPPVAALSQT